MLDWMKSTQGYSALMMTIWPAVLIGVLPIGCVFYRNGSLTAPDFITIAILSLGIVGPLVGAIFLTDDFSKIATITGEIGSPSRIWSGLRRGKNCMGWTLICGM